MHPGRMGLPASGWWKLPASGAAFLAKHCGWATKKDVGAKPKRVELGTLLINNARLQSKNLRLLTQQRKGHLELGPGA